MATFNRSDTTFISLAL